MTKTVAESRWIRGHLGLAVLLFAELALGAPPVVTDDDNKIFELGRFRFESGLELPNARLSYVTHGVLNDEQTNAVLVPSWYSGDHHGYEFLIGPGEALDPAEYFIVATDMFANGFSSSPSNTPPPYAGPDFPEIAIRDNVRAVHRLLSEELGVKRLRAVIGFSMGAQQALQWAVSYPEMVSAVVAICGNAKEYPFGIVRLEGAKSALMADSAWNGGRYDKPPEVGLRALARHWASWGVSQEWWRRETYRELGYDSIKAPLIPDAKLVPIPSIWGHGAGAGRGPGDAEFLNRTIANFLEGK